MQTRVIVVVVVDADHVDEASATIWSWGPDAIGEWDLGNGAIELRCGLSPDHATELVAHLQHLPPPFALIEARTEPDDSDRWVDTWRPHAEPFDDGRVRLRLPEHATTPRSATDPANDHVVDLVIEPGGAFGYTHPTTLLVLAMLADRPPVRAHVADIGAGSGILSLAAAQLGATVVHGVDIDPRAQPVATANATSTANAISTAINTAGTIDEGNPLRSASASVEFFVGSVEALPLPAYDTIVANCTIGDLTPMLGEIVEHLAPGGELLVSGILVDQCDRIIDQSGLVAVERTSMGEWHALRLTHGATHR